MTYPATGSSLLPPHPQERRDDRQRAIIDHAIEVQESSNTVAALEYLKSRDVAPGVIERVLLEPARRRAIPAR